MKALAAVAALLLTLTAVAPLSAQAPSVTAEVDKSAVTTDDVITLSIMVEGGNQASQPQLPLLDGLVVLGTSSVSQVSITNGKMVSSFLFEYRLAATRTGKITIEPISIGVDGVEHLTRPIEIDVSQGTGSLAVPTPAPDFDFGSGAGSASLTGQDHFLEAGVDDPAPYLGEQVTYFRKYYRARDGVGVPRLIRRSYNPPTFDGFWHLDLSDEGRYETSAAGRRYEVFEERTVLFPSLVGELTIDPASMRVSEGLGRSQQVLVTEPVVVNVRPLPQGAPAGFDGAVGDYSIEASVDSDRLSGGEPATLTITIRGAGNIDALPAPNVPASGDWRVFTQGSDSSSQVFRGVLRGSKAFEFLLLPNDDGALQIPSFTYVYFDPDNEAYVTLSTDPIRVEIEPGSVDRAAVDRALIDAEGEQAQDATPAAESWTLKPLDGPISTQGRGFAGTAWYLALFALPALLILAIETVRRRGALSAAFRVVKGRGEPPPTGSGAHTMHPDRRLAEFLSARLGQSVAGWGSDRLARELVTRGVDAGLLSEVFEVIEFSNAARFAPPIMRPGGPVGESSVEDIIGRLDRALE